MDDGSTIIALILSIYLVTAVFIYKLVEWRRNNKADKPSVPPPNVIQMRFIHCPRCDIQMVLTQDEEGRYQCGNCGMIGVMDEFGAVRFRQPHGGRVNWQ